MKSARLAAGALLLALPVLAAGVWDGSVFGSRLWASGGAAAPLPTFFLDPSSGSGPSNLSSTLTVNGTGMTTALDCDARTISGTSWPCATGGTFTENGSGASPTSGLGTPFTESGSRAMTNTAGAKNHIAPSSSVANFTTEDLVFEVVWRMGTAGYSIASSNSGGASGGWELIQSGTTGVQLLMGVAGGASVSTTNPGGYVVGSWNHTMVFADRSGNARVYTNGTFGTSTVISTVAASIASSNTVLLKGRPATAGQTGDDQLAMLRIWSCAACLNTTAEQDTIAKERFNRLVGTYPAMAGTPLPTTMTRSGTACVDIDRDDDGVRRLALVGANWPMFVRRKDGATSTRYNGIIVEQQRTNNVLQSQTLATGWLVSGVTTAEGSIVAPSGESTADTLTENAAAATTHYISSAAFSYTNATTYTGSVWVKSRSRGSVLVYLNGPLGLSGGTCFRLDTCAKVADYTTPPTSSVGTDYGSGWCRLAVTKTSSAAAADGKLEVYGSTSTSACTITEISYNGNSSAMVDMWGAQVETGSLASSYIPTTTATVTRGQSTLTYSATNNASNSGTIEAKVICPSALPPATSNVGGLLTVRLGTAGAQWWELKNDVNAGVGTLPSYRVYSGSVDQGTSTFGSTIWDGNVHTLRLLLNTNNIRAFRDGVAATPDTTATLPTSVDSVAIGSTFLDNGANSECMIVHAKVWPTEVLP